MMGQRIWLSSSPRDVMLSCSLELLFYTSFQLPNSYTVCGINPSPSESLP